MFNKKYKKRIHDLEILISHLDENKIKQHQELQDSIDKKSKDLKDIEQQIKNTKDKLYILKDEEYFQSIGFYDFNYKYKDSNEYKIKLSENIKQQKEQCKNIKCMIIPAKDSYNFNNNPKEGNKFVKSFMLLCLENFNYSCDKFINQITFYNYPKVVTQITNNYERINKKLAYFEAKILKKYLDLKLEQSEIQYELQIKLLEEKELKKLQYEIIKDSLQAENELKKSKEKLDKEINKARYEYNKACEKNNKEKQADLLDKIKQLETDIDDNEYWLTHDRAGYVYVVSNSDMKNGQIKIGVTRRKIEDRMKELGSGASHSFGMNVHGFIFCDDCFKVESDVHKFLNNKRINTVNPRKEWFNVTLEDVKKAFYVTNGLNINLSNSDEVYDQDYLISKNKFDFL